MTRWFAFDRDTASALSPRLAPGAVTVTDATGPLELALSRGSGSVVLLPSATENTVLVLTVMPGRKAVPIRDEAAEDAPNIPALKEQETVVPEPAIQEIHTEALAPRHAEPAPPETKQISTFATGILGLTDSPMFEDEPEEKKKWWQKLIGE